MIKVFTKDSNGKISFTQDELKKLLDEAYWEGYNSNHNNTYTYRSPYSPWSWTTTASTVTLNSNTAADSITSGNRYVCTIPADSITNGETYVGSGTATGK